MLWVHRKGPSCIARNVITMQNIKNTGPLCNLLHSLSLFPKQWSCQDQPSCSRPYKHRTLCNRHQDQAEEWFMCPYTFLEKGQELFWAGPVPPDLQDWSLQDWKANFHFHSFSEHDSCRILEIGFWKLITSSCILPSQKEGGTLLQLWKPGLGT